MTGNHVDRSALLLEARNISKSFGGIGVLEAVTFELRRGEVHALVGEKSSRTNNLQGIENGSLPEMLYSERRR